MANDKWSGSNPWLGLAPYTEGTPLYGRTKESIQLADIIKDYTASVVFGKSGIGKSSLLSAGISPLLREENYIPVRIRLVHNTEIPYIEQIESKVRETVNCIDRLPSDVNNLGLWDFFHRHSFTTENGIDCIPVIILDQFEEIYTLTDADHKKEIISFFNELSSLLNDIKPDNVIEEERKHSAVQNDSATATPKRGIIKRSVASALNYTSATTFRFVICLREDKLYLLERNSTNIPSLKANRYNLQALSPDSALEVIMCPRPELFSNEEVTAIVDKLADMGDEGIRTVDPAILSLFLYKYFEKQGQANYDNIFADYYQEATKDIKGKSIAFLEDHLLTLGGYRNQVPLDDALSSGVTQEDIQSLLQSIIIRKEQRKGIDYIEFSHDRLCEEAKKNRDDRAVQEQARKARKRMLLSFLVFVVSAAILSIVLWLTLKYQTSEEGRRSEILQKQLLKEKNDSLALLDALNKHQTDSLLVLNEKNLVQKIKIEHQRDELEIKNKELKRQLTKIKEQQHIIDVLQSGNIRELTIINEAAGKLSEILPFNALVNATSLTISGDLNGTDLAHLRNAFNQNLKHLNLENANIVSGGVAYYKQNRTLDNIIGSRLFFEATSLVTIILPKNTKQIGSYAFSGCSSLASVTIPICVTSIGSYAFSGCSSLTSVTIPPGITSISMYTFSNCTSLTSIMIPDDVITIGSYAFWKCSGLLSITIPKSVTEIGDKAFLECEFLHFINKSSCNDKNHWGAKVYNKSNNGFVIENNNLIRYRSYRNVAEIPESVKTVKKHAFEGCFWLTKITIPENVNSIEGWAFKDCINLTSVNIPNSITEISGSTFSGCSTLCSVVVPDGVSSIGTYAFDGCTRLTSVTIPNSVVNFGSFAFRGCSNISSISIPNSMKSIAYGAFYGCTGLVSITIPENVTSVEQGAFYGCSSLASITLPRNMSSIGMQAFENCINLSHIYSKIEIISNVQFLKSKNNTFNQFKGIPPTCTWHVPFGKSDEYTSQPWWDPSWHIVEETVIEKEIQATYNNGVLNVNGVKYNMLPVEGDTFLMRTSDDMIAAGIGLIISEDGDTIPIYEDSERLVHEVTLDDYRIGETEITQALWTSVMGYNPSENKGDDLPVDNVSWYECIDFIFKLNLLTGKNFKLPTEAEWEFAARGGNKSKHTFYSGSNNPLDVG